MANQFKLLLLLPVISLLHEGILSSSVLVERDVDFGANCLFTQQQYDRCNEGRGYCDYPGHGKGILKCYEGLACGAFQKVEHGSFVLTIPEYNVLGATAELTCCSGYHADGATNITCGVNSTWSTTSGTCEANVPAVDCTDCTTSGVYAVSIGGNEVDLLLEMEDGSMWTVIQQRVDDTVDFYRGWAAYKQGFGNLTGNFWLGLDNIYNIVGTGTYRVKFYITDTIHGTKTATYETFSITDESDEYRLTISGYSGDAGDSMAYHNAMPFSTYDHGNVDGCATAYVGAWWYNFCHTSNLNGEYGNTENSKGINWVTTTTYVRSATYARIQLQRVSP